VAVPRSCAANREKIFPAKIEIFLSPGGSASAFHLYRTIGARKSSVPDCQPAKLFSGFRNL
jgi:hypothetical protein